MLPMLFFMLESIRVNAFGSLALTIITHFKIGALEYSKLSSFYLLGNVVFLLLYGILLDRYSLKKVFAFSLSICVLASAGEALAKTYEQLLFFSFLGGVGASPAFILSMKLIKEWYSEKHLALMTGILICAAMLGGFLAQSPLLYIVHEYSWKVLLIFLIGTESAVLLCVLCLIPQKQKSSIQPGPKIKELLRLTLISLRDSIKNIVNWQSGLFTCILNLPITLLGALWAPSYLIVVCQVTKEQASIITTGIFIGAMIGLPTLGVISDKLNTRKGFMLGGAVICLLISLSLIIVKLHNVYVLWLLFLGLGLASSVQSLGYTIVSENNPLSRIGVSMSFVGMLVMCGGLVFQPLIGYLLDVNRQNVSLGELLTYSANDYRIAFAIFPILFLASTLLVLRPNKNNSK
jgi:MFS family permease